MILGEGEQYFEFPFMTEIAPAFTVELKNVKTPVEIVDVGANFTSQPLEYRGAFQCSDERLNRIWKVSRWAVQICLQTHHLDSPNHQEPICDPGDYVIEAMVNDYAFAQPWLTRQDVRKFAWLLKDEKYHNFHTSYSIGWLQMLMDYYDYTGDKSLVEEMAPYVHELLDTYASWRGKNGLISEAPNYMFMDWVDIAGFGCHHPPAVIGQGYLTAFYYHGLEMASRVAEMTGDTARVEKYAKLRGEIAAAFNRELWVADKGLYRDGKPFQTSVKPGPWLPADKDIETFSPHVNLLAVLYDLAPKEQQPAIVEKVLAEKPLNTQPWFMHWVFQAIDHAGLFDRYGTPQMRRWRIVPRDAIVPRNVERRRPQPRLVLDAAGADVGPRARRAADLARLQDVCRPPHALRSGLGERHRADAARRRGRVVEVGRRQAATRRDRARRHRGRRRRADGAIRAGDGRVGWPQRRNPWFT